MFKNESFSVLDWILFMVLVLIPLVNIVFVVIFIFKKGLFYTIKKLIVALIIGIILVLIGLMFLNP